MNENTARYRIEARSGGWTDINRATCAATSEIYKILRRGALRAMVPGLTLSAILLAGLFATTPVRSQAVMGGDFQSEPRNLSSALKTFICAGERAVPEWCEAYRAAKFSTSVSDNTRARKKAEKALKEKIAAEKKALAERKALEAKLALAAKELEEKSTTKRELTEEELKVLAEIEAEKKLKAWEEFLGGVDMKNVTIDQVIKAKEFVTSDDRAEANEFLGLAYSQGSKNLAVNLSESYRQYGLAYLKGLKHVKPKMDVIWPKLSPDEQTAVLEEFKSDTPK